MFGSIGALLYMNGLFFLLHSKLGLPRHKEHNRVDHDPKKSKFHGGYVSHVCHTLMIVVVVGIMLHYFKPKTHMNLIPKPI